ncbi:unnamed protein product (macronuclear) [Paramecium tetraurelia]|uniref:Uncharacterized protein n=1 Tax=Paramecium tetraurelia TaxID=5888 RepID=A0EEK2_PARTE|nr:uncharacterized protein GSPATT00026065001 [Paramecium tetraurelia]CAK93735.1 unnamed protein product [Paramecium tetraurelia]|eukprot:XP_001461116.1 hypothetical protein (macronuclear) [Paramecium tetraurelia strain d4-2]
MKRRPQSAIITKLIRERQESASSQMIYSKKQTPQQVAPKEYFEDQEQLYFVNLQLKQQCNEIKQENQKLKAYIAQLKKQIVRIEKVDKYQVNCDPLGVIQSGEGSIVPILKAKVKEQRNQIEELQTDLHQQYKSVKLTKLSELQREIQNQQNEIMKLRQVIQSALNITDQDLVNDPNVIEKLSKFTITVHQQENSIQQLIKQNDKLKIEYQEMSNDNAKLLEEMKYLNFEKINYKKQLEEQTITESEIYQQKKREFLEMKLAYTSEYIYSATLKQLDTLKGELSLYENKSKSLQKQIKDQEKEFKQSTMELQKQKQNLEDQCNKKDIMIQDLNDRINILDLLKQKNSPKPSESPLTLQHKKSFSPPTTYRDEMTQFPENQSSDINSDANCSPINKNQLEVLFQQLKFKILSQKLTKERIHFTFHNKEFIQLGEAIQVFMNAPYNFQKSDSIILCRYLIGEDQGFSNSLQFQDTQEVREIIDQLYSHPKIKSEYLTFQTILKQNYYSKLVNQKLVQCNIPSKIYNRDDFILLLKNNFNFTYEQIDYMLMMNYLYSNEVDNIDINVLRKFIQQECDLQATLHNLAYVCQESIRYIPKKINKVSYSDDDQSNFPIVESKDLKSVQTQRDDSKIEMRPPELSNQVQNIITSEQYLTFSQFKNSDQQLKSSESRKPSNHNNNSDILQYSQSLLPQATLKRPSEYQQITSDNSIHFNITNQFQSPQQNKKRINQISEFQTGKEIVDQRNIQYNVDNDTQITDVNKKEDEYYEEIQEEYIEEL